MAEKPFSLSFNNVVQFTDRIAISIFVYEQKNIFVYQNVHVSAYTVIISHKRMAAELVSFQVK